MTNTERIQANNAELRQAIEMAETLPDSPNETLDITENGMYNVLPYYLVDVNVPDSGEEVASLLGNTMTELNNSIVTSLRTRACQGATNLVDVNLPNVTSLGSYAFYGCSGLVTCKIPKLTSVSTQTWYSCTKLRHADCGNLGNISAQTFNACSALTVLILRKTGSICTLANVNGVNNTPIGKGTGYVYVNENMINAYVSASNWSTFPNQFRPLVDTIADLESIDGSVYDRVWVDDEYCVYIYDGSAWAKES